MKENKTNSEIMEQLVKECEEVLLRFLPDPDNMPEGEAPTATIASAMRYSAMAGGKRLRPLLIARICDMYGGRRELAEPFMAGLEMTSRPWTMTNTVAAARPPTSSTAREWQFLRAILC